MCRGFQLLLLLMIGVKVSALSPLTCISSCASVESSLDLHINTGDPGEVASSISAASSSCSGSRRQPLFNLGDNQEIFQLRVKQISIKSEHPGRLSTMEYCLLFRPLVKGVVCCKQILGRSPFKAQCQGFTPGLVVSLDPWDHLPS